MAVCLWTGLALIGVMIGGVTMPPTASAKDLSGRLGIGFTNDFSNSTAARNVPAVSVKYGASKDLHVLGALGFNTLDPASFTLGGKIFKNIFYETNLNFYSSVGLAYLKDAKSGIEILGVLGCEFFIPGIDSLGLLFETGVSASNVTGSFAIKTVGYTFINAGMHFYF
ncbi:MAG: hypothetical protein HY075_03760 [Deltaproteobacteria bacterium]|nr:hypothetical protein [Deltaproteobacteria bacterium]